MNIQEVHLDTVGKRKRIDKDSFSKLLIKNNREKEENDIFWWFENIYPKNRVGRSALNFPNFTIKVRFFPEHKPILRENEKTVPVLVKHVKLIKFLPRLHIFS